MAKKEIKIIEDVSQFKCKTIERIDVLNDALEDNFDNDIDFLGELSRMKSELDNYISQLRSKIETESNSEFRHGSRWVVKWSERAGSTTLDKNALRESIGEEELKKFEKVGKPSKMMKIEPLIDNEETIIEEDSQIY